MNREHLVPQERKRLKRVERVDSKYTRQLSVFANRFQSAIQRGHRIIGKQETNPRIVVRAALAIQYAKAVEPRRSALSGPDPNFERENLGRQLVVAIQILQ